MRILYEIGKPYKLKIQEMSDATPPSKQNFWSLECNSDRKTEKMLEFIKHINLSLH